MVTLWHEWRDINFGQIWLKNDDIKGANVWLQKLLIACDF